MGHNQLQMRTVSLEGTQLDTVHPYRYIQKESLTGHSSVDLGIPD